MVLLMKKIYFSILFAFGVAYGMKEQSEELTLIKKIVNDSDLIAFFACFRTIDKEWFKKNYSEIVTIIEAAKQNGANSDYKKIRRIKQSKKALTVMLDGLDIIKKNIDQTEFFKNSIEKLRHRVRKFGRHTI